MDQDDRTLETAVYAMAEGFATREQIALLEADPAAWRSKLERLIDDTEDQLDEVRQIQGPERDQVVADFLADLRRLEAAYDLLTRVPDPMAVIAGADPGGEVRLQASWEAGKIVVWAAGPGTAPETNDEMADSLEVSGGPTTGWSPPADDP
jgi:ABC-type sugar transport system substrate-binding protein